jgi:uncharacterized protein (UPF0262 family)
MTRSERASGQKSHRLVAVTLDEASIGRSGPDVEHERAVAIYDLLEDNMFAPVECERGPFKLHLSIRGSRLVFDIRRANDAPVMAHLLSLSPLRRLVKDYFMVCDSYYAAIAPRRRTASRRSTWAALHDEGSHVLMERLKRRVTIDFDTARRLFTLICVLHWKDERARAPPRPRGHGRCCSPADKIRAFADGGGAAAAAAGDVQGTRPASRRPACVRASSMHSRSRRWPRSASTSRSTGR